MDIYVQVKTEEKWKEILSELEERSSVKWRNSGEPTNQAYHEMIYFDKNCLLLSSEECKEVKARSFVDAIVEALPKPKIKETKKELVAEIKRLNEAHRLAEKIREKEEIRAKKCYDVLEEEVRRLEKKISSLKENKLQMVQSQERLISDRERISKELELEQKKYFDMRVRAETAEDEIKRLRSLIHKFFGEVLEAE